MPRFNRLSLSLASTAAVALASLPLAFTPANAAKGSEGTTSSIGVIETSSDAQQFNLKTQGRASNVLVAKCSNDPEDSCDKWILGDFKNFPRFRKDFGAAIDQFINSFCKESVLQLPWCN